MRKFLLKLLVIKALPALIVVIFLILFDNQVFGNFLSNDISSHIFSYSHAEKTQDSIEAVSVFSLNSTQYLQKSKSANDEEFEEILLVMEYAGILKTFLSSIYFHDKVFVSLSEFFNNLQIPFNKVNKSIFEGLINEGGNYFFIDFDEKKYKSGTYLYQLDTNDYIKYNEDYYVSVPLIEKILSLRIELDFSNLALLISSDRHLPVYTKYLIERKYASMKRTEKDKFYPLLFNRERYLINGFVFDYNISQTLIKNQRSGYFYTAAIGGELLYGDFFYSRNESSTHIYKSRTENFNWKFTFNPNKYLTQISIGDDFLEGINLYNVRGLRFTNEVIEPRKKIGYYFYQDKTEPNSLIELYANNELIDIARADQSGNYLFEFPLRYGMSNLEFRIYTVTGKLNISRKVFQVPYDLLPQGTFNYSLASGFIKFTKNKFANIDLRYGIKNFLTVAAGSEFIQDSIKRQLNFFGKSTFQISPDFFINLFYSPKIMTRIQGFYIRADYASYSFEFTEYKKNHFYNPKKFKKSFLWNFYYPQKFKNSEIGFYINHEHHQSDLERRNKLSLSTFYLYNWISLNLGVINENTKNTGLIKRRELNLGTTFNFNNLFKEISVLNRSYLSTRSVYNLTNNKLQIFSLFTSTAITQNLRFQINYDRFLITNTYNLSLNLFLETPQARYTVNSNAQKVIDHQLSGSIGYSPQLNMFYFYSEPQIGRASLYIEGFEDRNGNNLMDKEEKNIKGIDFSINSAAYSKKTGEAKLFCGLSPYQEYTIKINESGLVNPNVSSEYSEFNLLTDGNRLKIIRLPYYETGEISGIVVREFEMEEIPMPNVRLIIQNLSDSKEINILTFSDGTFYFFGLRKGKYILKIDDDYLNKVSLNSFPEKIEIEINPLENELIIDDIKFTLK